MAIAAEALAKKTAAAKATAQAVRAAAAPAASAASSAAGALKPARGIIAALTFSLIVVTMSSFGKSKKFPSTQEIIATIALFVMLGFVAEVNPRFGRAFAVLVAVGVLFSRGEDALKAVGVFTSKRAARAVRGKGGKFPSGGGTADGGGSGGAW